MTVSSAGTFGGGLKNPDLAVDPAATFDDHQVAAGANDDPAPLDVGDGLESGELLVLALEAIAGVTGRVPPAVWRRVDELLTADDRTGLRTLRDQLLHGGISDVSAAILNQLTHATSLANEARFGRGGLTWTEGTD